MRRSACTCESRRTGILGKILYYSTVLYSQLREVCANKFRDQAWRSYPDLHLQSDSSTFQSEISLEGRVHSGSASANRWLGCGQMLAPVLSMALKFGV